MKLCHLKSIHHIPSHLLCRFCLPINLRSSFMVIITRACPHIIDRMMCHSQLMCLVIVHSVRALISSIHPSYFRVIFPFNALHLNTGHYLFSH